MHSGLLKWKAKFMYVFVFNSASHLGIQNWKEKITYATCVFVFNNAIHLRILTFGRLKWKNNSLIWCQLGNLLRNTEMARTVQVCVRLELGNSFGNT